MTPEQLIARVDQARDIFADESGYMTYLTLSAEQLRTIADELDRRNADWDAQVKEDLKYDRERAEFEDWIMGDFEV